MQSLFYPLDKAGIRNLAVFTIIQLFPSFWKKLSKEKRAF